METKKIVSTLLAAGMAVPALPIYAYADSSASLPESATKIDNDNKEDSFVSSVVVINQTDTSITIKWDVNNYKDYSISVNNKVIANNLVDNTYTITELKSASEYFIKVSAYDENGVLAVSSDEICAYTNLTVSSNYTLTDDIKAANVNIDSGTLNLNGHTMTVTGNVWVSRSNSTAYLSINKGKLYVNGDFNLCHANKEYSHGYLTMQNAEDYVCVGGDFYINTYYSCSTLTAGTLELKGNFTQKFYGYSNNFYASGTHKVILSGEGLQTVSFDSTDSQFNVVEITKPIDTGYVFSNTKWNDLIENYDEPTPPTAPYDLTFVRSTSTSIVLKWNSSIGFKDIFCYQVYRNGELVGTTTKTEYIDNGLTSHTKYEYYIVAVDVGGSRSENSSSLIAYTNVDQYAPTTPTGLVVKIREDGSIYATWIASSDNVRVDGYNIYRNGEIIDTVSGTSYKDLNVKPGYHEYYVEAFDNEGNTSMFSESVFIDNMPPRKPVLSINEITSASISFEWDSEDNIGISQYKIYKNDQLLRTTADNQYVDTAVLAGEKYSYCVIAIDTSGNVSEASDSITLVAGEDENAPESVLKSSNLTDNNKILTIQCVDDVLLSSVKVEIKSPSSDEWEKILEQKLSQRIQNVNIDMSDHLGTGGTYFVRTTLIDAFGNENINEYQFAYYANELSEFELTAAADGCDITLNWTSASPKDDVYYVIYRTDSDGNKSAIATTGYDQHTYTIRGLKPSADYSYQIIARDSNLYSSQSNIIEITTGKDSVDPVAVAGNDITVIEGYTIKVNGDKSTDNNGIVSYHWDFGDGTSADTLAASHSYADEGVYTVSLTVIDESGNSGTDTLKVTVYDKTYSITEIKAVDESGKALPATVAYCEIPDVPKMNYSDDNGIILLVAPQGTYVFSFFNNGYIPVSKEISLDGVNTGANKVVVSLVKSDIVTPHFEIEELDINQINDLNIDTSKEENRHISKVTIELKNNISGTGSDADLSHFNIYVNQTGDIMQIEHDDSFTVPVYISLGTVNYKSTDNTSGTKTSTSLSSLGSGIASSTKPKYEKVVYKVINGTMVSLSVTEYSWLKNIYKVSVSFTNNSGEGFDIIDSKARLNLPDGLSLVSMNSPVYLTQEMGTINGGATQSASWIIKGDKQGSYNISVDFEGMLLPFEIPLQASFTNSDSINVSVDNQLKLNIYSTNANYSKFLLENNTSEGEPLYDVRVDMSIFEDINDAEYIVLKYPSGLIEKIEWSDDSKSETQSTVYLPVTVSHNVDLVSLRTLEKGQKIEGVIYYSFREIDD